MALHAAAKNRVRTRSTQKGNSLQGATEASATEDTSTRKASWSESLTKQEDINRQNHRGHDTASKTKEDVRDDERRNQDPKVLIREKSGDVRRKEKEEKKW